MQIFGPQFDTSDINTKYFVFDNSYYVTYSKEINKNDSEIKPPSLYVTLGWETYRMLEWMKRMVLVAAHMRTYKWQHKGLIPGVAS